MIPEHYSRDIAQRCQSLIQELFPIVKNGLSHDGRYGGPLSTTFLLALATPMIVLPIERILKPANPQSQQAADDRNLDPALADEVIGVFGPGRLFGAVPFARPDQWSYVADYPPFNVAGPWPADLLERLGTGDAFRGAMAAPTSRVLTDLRNGLAHGGVAYLDAYGYQTGGEAAMLAFAGTRLDRRTRRIIGLNILRIGEPEFFAFLMEWANWLGQPRIRAALNDIDPLAA